MMNFKEDQLIVHAREWIQILLVTLFFYLMNASMWWLMGLAIILNHLFNKPILILALLSPVFFIENLFDSKFYIKPSILDLKKYLLLNIFETLGLVLLSFGICFLIYLTAIKSYRKFNHKFDHPLVPPLLIIIILIALNAGAKNFQYNQIHIVLFVVSYFFTSVFVILAYEFKDDEKLKRIPLIKRFSMLSTMHVQFFHPMGTQLSPKGLLEIFEKTESDKNLRIYWRKKALQLFLICFVIHVFYLAFGHMFFKLPVNFFKTIALPEFNFIDLKSVQTVPRYVVFNEEIDRLHIYLLVVLRAFHWFALKYVSFNSKIAVLWFMGIPIDLAILNPFKASSFVDFFRRTHVHIAHFYKMFIFQYVSKVVGFKSLPIIKKYISVWLLIACGGFLFQSISHSYQLFNWSYGQVRSVLMARACYDIILASAITLSLYLEKKFRPKHNKWRILRSSIYIIFYSILLSLSASAKFSKFSASDLFHYLEILIGF